MAGATGDGGCSVVSQDASSIRLNTHQTPGLVALARRLVVFSMTNGHVEGSDRRRQRPPASGASKEDRLEVLLDYATLRGVELWFEFRSGSLGR